MSGTLSGADIAFTESTTSIELAGAAEKAATAKPDASVPSCVASCERM
jgi:hypothetical protein